MHQKIDNNLLCDAIVDSNSGQIFGDKSFFAVSFNDAALQTDKTIL